MARNMWQNMVLELMLTPENNQIVIPAGTMINTALHEDSDYEILKRDFDAIVVCDSEIGAWRIIIPEMDPELEWYFHQPEKTI
jgi:hypothetical protein